MRVSRLVKKILPGGAVLAIQKRRYARALSGLNVDDCPEFKAMNDLVAPGDTVVDVGANMGEYTVILSRIAGNAGKVFSVEPIPRTFELLCHDIRALGLSNVVPMNFAASRRNGDATMEIPDTDDGDPDFFLARIADGSSHPAGRLVRVPLRTLDAALEEASARVRFMKIDVEGHELECLEGAASILRAAKPALLVEIWGDPDEPWCAAWKTFDFLRQRGYRAFVAEADGRLMTRTAGMKSVNYFFLPEGWTGGDESNDPEKHS
jgi:FkbM family methyltransferase